MKCTCGQTLTEYEYTKEDGSTKRILVHPGTKIPCETNKDGVEIKVVDEFLNNTFTELMEKAGVDNSKDDPFCDIPSPQPLKESGPLKADRKEILKDRLCEGKIPLNEFDEIIKRLE